MKSKCDKGHFHAYHTILHQADCLFDDSEHLEFAKNGDNRGGFSNYYMPLLLVYIAAIEAFSNSIGFVLIEDFVKKYEKNSIKDKLKRIFKKLGECCDFGKEPFKFLDYSIETRNDWVHCKASKEEYATEWESLSLEDFHNIHSKLENKTNKEFIAKLKNIVHEIIESVSSKARERFPNNKELMVCLCDIRPVVETEIGKITITRTVQ